MDPEEQLDGYGAAVILLILCSGLFFMSSVIKNRLVNRYYG